MTQPTIIFKKLNKYATIPQYQTAGASGTDLHWDGTLGGFKDGARNPTKWAEHGVCCEPLLYGTGLSVEIPEGFEGQIRPRSSLGKFGIHCYFGTIDSDYRGELLVRLQLLTAHEGDTVCIERGDRIAQLVISPVARCVIQVAEELSCTQRATGSFGSTGR